MATVPLAMNPMLLSHFRLLFSQEMYDDAEVVGSLLFTATSQVYEAEMFEPTQHVAYHSFLVNYGDCFYHRNIFKRAQEIFEIALSVRRLISDKKIGTQTGASKSSALPPGDSAADIEFKFKLHRCYFHLRMLREALSILESIPQRQRSAKIVLAMARLYEKRGNAKAAGTCYKVVLKECPLSFVLIEHVLNRRLVKFSDIIAAVQSNSFSNDPSAIADWVFPLVRGIGSLCAQDARESIVAFASLTDRLPLLEEDFHIGIYLARSLLLRGHFIKAVKLFERLHARCPSEIRFTDSYAYYLYCREQLPELSQLCRSFESSTGNNAQQCCQAFVAMTYAAILRKSGRNALSLAKRAVELDEHNLHAKLALAHALRSLDQKRDSENQLTKLVAIAPSFYEAHDSLVTNWLKTRCFHKQALQHTQAYAANFKGDPRFHLLAGNVMRQLPTQIEAARQAYQRALKIDPTIPDACLGLAQCLVETKRFQAALELLNQSLELEPSSLVHQLLAECYYGLGFKNEAMSHFNLAAGDSRTPEAQILLRKVQNRAHDSVVAALTATGFVSATIDGSASTSTIALAHSGASAGVASIDDDEGGNDEAMEDEDDDSDADNNTEGSTGAVLAAGGGGGGDAADQEMA